MIVNLAFRPALGDALADALLAEVQAALAVAVEDPGAYSGAGNKYDIAVARQEAIREAWRQQGELDAHFPTTSRTNLQEKISAECRRLLADFRREGAEETPAGAILAAVDLERAQAPEPDGRAAEEIHEHDDGQQEVDERPDEVADAPLPHDRALIAPDWEVTVRNLASIAAEIAQELGVAPLPLRDGCVLTRLPFVPPDWSDQTTPRDARQANDLSDLCDALKQAPRPPPQDPHSCAPPPGFLNDAARHARSAGTLYLAWVRLAFLGQLDRCRVTGLPLRWAAATCTSRDPLRVTKVAHLVHDLPISHGFSVQWPTSLRQFDYGRWNVSVESWFGNCWLKTHRPASLAATLSRRTESLVQATALMEFAALDEEEREEVVQYCRSGLALPASFAHNYLLPG
ncbi:hypothetical protein BCV69DRAFT_65459 [Microstroma glucosiphilum]|uniref:Uncharacterized protein n=1 Tax=Pseudomicrostroma glucosiphilum TaxID=1684307 RepID=A0A316U112_9BASI|nr:hypothetical protein BCV69DRAFT_65459 [Pseudomicrostroma glucosiphilum]PWN18548.1 hypothetical protein BCV69DRAFT_65459 [Pseudomicrostroma glucosiphilum]